jgi:TolB-like protein/Tfp pilus assembly protein PilF
LSPTNSTAGGAQQHQDLNASHVHTLSLGDEIEQARKGSKRVLNPCTTLKTRRILEWMPLVEAGGRAARQELERVLQSPCFARNERLSRFLRFVVERHLEGRDDELKESVIAVEVFGRRPDYNPKHDAIVRTEAGRLRARLSEYYLGEGRGDPLLIELPKGGYAPRFRQTERKGWEQKATPRHAWPTVALAGLTVALAAAGWWWVRHKSAPVAIAVLPLNNMSQDPANDYFADGLTSEIIRNLSIIDGLAVRSQTSSFAFKGKPRTLREVGKQMEADFILEGSVLLAGHQLRINAQFVRVRDDLPLWSGRFDRELTDVFAIQDEISRGIVNSLRLKLGRGRRRYETSVEAYNLYLRARAQQVRRGVYFYGESIAPLKEAIAKDPSFAPAYASLALAYGAQAGQFQFDIAGEVEKMRVAAEKAIQLDPLLAEAHDALGMAFARGAQWEQSEKSFRRAIEIEPGRSESYEHFVMWFLLPLGRIEEALLQVRAAEKADPLSPHGLGYVLHAAGRYDEAASYFEKLPADSPLRSAFLGQARLGQRRIGEALQILETALRQDVNAASAVRGILGCAYARARRREEAEKLAADSSLNPFNQAQTFACLGDKDRSFEALDRAAAAGPVRMGRMLTFQGYSLLHGDLRLQALRKKVGLPEN